jgi:DNA-binding GntR family transcriptional regulator
MSAASAGTRTADHSRPSKSLVSGAYDTIKRQILNNEFGPGFQILERDLAEQLGMSRTPVHEALIRLQAEGMVEVTPRHGMRVQPVSAADMKEIYQILTSLESTAAELLARRRPSGEELAPMQAACTAMEGSLELDDLQAWAEADEDFHSRLLRACGNRRLMTICFNFWDQTHRARMMTLRLRPRPVASTKDHRALLNAIEQGDFEAAREIHRSHRVRGGHLMVELLEYYNLRHV